MKNFKIISYLTVLIFCINMGTGTQKDENLGPKFVNLTDNQPSYSGKIVDGGKEIELKDLSFSGHVTIGGIRSEEDDSVSKLDLGRVIEIDILDPNYQSKKYQDQDFIKIKAISNDGTIINNLLIPRNVVICGVEKNTLMDKAWHIQKINKIILDRAKTKEDLEDEDEHKVVAKEGFVSKIKSVFEKQD